MYPPTSSTSRHTAARLLCLLAFSLALSPSLQAFAQPAPAPHPAVPLVSGSCPSVHAGDSITFDWNPDFDNPGSVAGLKDISLTFLGTLEDGVTVNPRRSLFLPRSGGHNISSLGNGYFRIESPLPVSVVPGVYQLIEASANPELLPDYKGEVPKPTVSPAREHYCITVLPRVRTPAP